MGNLAIFVKLLTSGANDLTRSAEVHAWSWKLLEKSAEIQTRPAKSLAKSVAVLARNVREQRGSLRERGFSAKVRVEWSKVRGKGGNARRFWKIPLARSGVDFPLRAALGRRLRPRAGNSRIQADCTKKERALLRAPAPGH